MKKLWIVALLAMLSACGQQASPPGMKVGKPYVIEGKTYYPEYDDSYDKTGMASWYGPGFHGKYTANGEVFNQNDLTAAHPTLPMPSLVRVTNLENGKSAIIRINDRGPFKSSRIIDLSRKSAQTLGIHSLAKVRVQYLKQETEAYMAQVKESGSNLDMAEYNKKAEQKLADSAYDRESAEIVESTVSTAHSGQTVSDAAPVVSVGSDDLENKSIHIADVAPIAAKPSAEKQKPKFSDAETFTGSEPEEKTIAESKPVKLSKHEEAIEETTESDASDIEPGAIMLTAHKEKSKPVKSQQAKSEHKKDLSPSSGGRGPGYYVNAGSFSTEQNAHKLTSHMSAVSKVKIDKVEVSGKSLWRVRSGPFADRSQAEESLEKVRAAGVADARVVKQ